MWNNEGAAVENSVVAYNNNLYVGSYRGIVRNSSKPKNSGTYQSE